MTEILELLKAVNGMTPIGIITLMAIIIFLLVKGRKDVKDLSDNHLHDLPLLVENSNRTVDVLQRIEVRLGEDLTYIKERVSRE